jgi:cytochrome c-type biogenesis protein CcmH/NrfF
MDPSSASGPTAGDRRRSRAGVLLAVALIAAAAALLAVGLRGTPPPASMQDRVRAVASGLRCPVCQDLSVADSPSALAREMRERIGTDLAAGRSPDAIRREFVRAYGDWILMSPPRHGLALVAWVIPAVLFGAGLGIAIVSIVRWTHEERARREPGATSPLETAGELGPADRRLLERALAAQGEDEE